MERAKKMVLISTENLERMQRQLQQQAITRESEENSRNSDESTNNSVRTPGTPLSRLDAEMSRILNSSDQFADEATRWKMYKQVLWRFLHLVRVAHRKSHRERVTPISKEEEEEEENADTHEGEEDADNFDVEAAAADLRELEPAAVAAAAAGLEPRELALKSNEILKNVPKSYRPRARSLMKYLLDKAVPARISWDEDGIVSIDGNLIKNSNITDLINDAMRERKNKKATGRVQFARLLRALNIPDALVTNKELLSTSARSTFITKFQPPASSTPNKLSLPKKRGDTKRGGKSSRKRRRPAEGEIVSADLPRAKKIRLLGWSKLR